MSSIGLGKSLQAVCLLHTLLTHPSLITPSTGPGSTPGGRIIFRAMLIAPVNTLANWETEFEKWVGTSSGRNIPAIRFYPWTPNSSEKKIIKEWYDYGGILCVSSEKYANSCKGFVEQSSKRKSKKKPSTTEDDSKEAAATTEGDSKKAAADAKKAAKAAEDEAFFRKALFNPGPDIVVLDEVHSMLKS